MLCIIDKYVKDWIDAFLKDLKQTVVEGESSNSAKVSSGVAQGTVLGPLFFLCFITDLSEQVSSHVRLFADDCLLYQPIRSLRDQIELQEDLSALPEWANVSGMRFNAKKWENVRPCAKPGP